VQQIMAQHEAELVARVPAAQRRALLGALQALWPARGSGR
jgi:hypothetical protein